MGQPGIGAMLHMLGDGIAATVIVVGVVAVAFLAGFSSGKGDITSDCQRFGEFDRLTVSYLCTVKPKP